MRQETHASIIVGAGPGDPGLITRPRPAAPRGRGRGGATTTRSTAACCGRRAPTPSRSTSDPPRRGALDQDAISLLLVEKAREGKTVVRLKWGDPFVFDSGGKEALFLHEQQIPFEVVPGIPAAIGVPAYAGIPITYPGAGDTVTLVRGNEAETDERAATWTGSGSRASTARWSCYAGARQVSHRSRRCSRTAVPPDESAALIYRRHDAGPGDDRRHARDHRRAGAAHRSRRCWSSARSSGCASTCAGSTIVRSSAAASSSRGRASRPASWSRCSRSAAREAIQAPTIRIAPPEDMDALDRACRDAGGFTWIVFTSANAVDSFMQRLLAGGDVRDLKGVRLCAIGPSTAQHLARYGLRVDLTPAEARSEAVLDALKSTGPLKGRALPAAARRHRARGARRSAARRGRETSARSSPTAPAGGAAARRRPRHLPHAAGPADRRGDVHQRQHGEELRQDPRRGTGRRPANATVVASIGPVTAEAAQQLGITHDGHAGAVHHSGSGGRAGRAFQRAEPRLARDEAASRST